MRLLVGAASRQGRASSVAPASVPVRGRRKARRRYERLAHMNNGHPWLRSALAAAPGAAFTRRGWVSAFRSGRLGGSGLECAYNRQMALLLQSSGGE